MKKFISMLLCLLMVAALLPATVLADVGNPLSLGELTKISIEYGYDGTECTFTPAEDGYYLFYSVSDLDTYAHLYQGETELTANDDADTGDNAYDFALKYLLDAGKTYTLAVFAYSSQKVTFEIGVEKTVGAVSGKVIDLPYRDTVVQGHEADTLSVSGLTIEFTMEDGTKEIWYADYDITVGGSEVVLDLLESNGEFVLSVQCDAAHVYVPYVVVENPVKSISYNGEGLTYYKETHGYWYGEVAYYYNYNSDIGEQIITIEYTDGTKEKLSLEDYFMYTDPVVEDTQETTPWQLGENAITVSYLGKETTIPVQILPCPYKNVTVNANPTKEYMLGDLYYGYTYDDTYYIDDLDLTGISLTFENHDGTTETYTAEDFDMENEELGGYECYLYPDGCREPGMVTVDLSYKGFDAQFQVKVVESPVEKLEVLGTPKKSEYESMYYPDLTGLSVKVTLKDGTSQTVQLDEKTLQYEIHNGFTYVIPVGDQLVYVNMDRDDDGKEVYLFYCVDQMVVYEGFTFVESRDIYDMEVVDFTADGMTVLLTYEEETAPETMILKKVCEQEWNMGEYVCVAQTEKGFIYYEVMEYYNEEGTLAGYEVELFNFWTFVDPFSLEPGDVNGDKKIDAKDALQVLKYAVGKAEFTLNEEWAADVNRDEKIDAKDALEILKYAVGKPSAVDKFYEE